ncbi:uncharacterized protein LOC120810736 isoform X2 [Gasterosteus aculeatus]
MGCSSSSAQTLDQENRPGTKPEESHGDPLAVGNGFIAEDAQTIEDQMQLPVQTALLDDLQRGADEEAEAVLVALEAQEDLGSGEDLLTALEPQPEPVSPLEPTPKAGSLAEVATVSLQPVEEAVHVGSVVPEAAAEDRVLVEASEEVPAVEAVAQTEAPAVEAVAQTEAPAVEAVAQTEAPAVEAVAQTEAPAVEAVAQTEAPAVEAVAQTEAPAVEAVAQTEAPAVEDVVQTEAPDREDVVQTSPEAAAPFAQLVISEPREASAILEEVATGAAKNPAEVLAPLEADAPANVSTAPCEALAPAPSEASAAGDAAVPIEGVAAGDAAALGDGAAGGDAAAPGESALPEKAESSAPVEAAQLLIDTKIAAATIPELPPLSPATAPPAASAESAPLAEPSCSAEAVSAPALGAESAAVAIQDAQVPKASVETATSEPAADCAASAEAPVVESTPAEAPSAPEPSPKVRSSAEASHGTEGGKGKKKD